MWKQVQVNLNGETVGNSNSLYSYGSILETYLSYGSESMKTIGSMGLFYKDTPGQMSTLNIATETKPDTTNNVVASPLAHNVGFLKRRKLIIDGKGIIECINQIHSDLFKSDRYLVDNCELEITLTKNTDAFLLLGKAGYKIVLQDVKIKIRSQVLSPEVQFAITNTMNKSNIFYPLKNNETKKFKMALGGLSVIQELSTGILPLRIVLGMVDSLAVIGKLELNPFDFQHFGLIEIGLSVDKKLMPYSSPIKLNFAKNLYLQGYQTLHEGVSSPFSSHDISREDYPLGYTLFVFNLEPTTSEGEFTTIPRTGSVSVELTFSDTTDTSKSVDLICYFEREGGIEIDSLRKIVSGAMTKLK